jgi:hypothetical protein
MNIRFIASLVSKDTNPCIIIYVVALPAIWLVTCKFRNPQRIAALIQV